MGNTQSSAGLPLHLADHGKELLKCAERGDTNIVTLIVGCNPQALSHSSVFGGNTVWHKAAKTGKVAVFEAMELVLQQAYEISSKDLSSSRVGLRRLGDSSSHVIKRVINKANMKGITPLMLACAGSHTEAVAWLLKHGADVWKHDRIRRQTALHCAAQAGATDAIRLLLANVGTEEHPENKLTLLEQGNHAGLTALHYAVYSDKLEVVQQLVAHSADITAQAEFPDLDWASVNAGDTVMHIAASKGNIEAIQIILRAYNEMSGAIIPNANLPRRVRDPRAMRNDYGRLPYHLAMRKGFTWLAELLDPSVPVRYLLAGEELDTTANWGPPRLATIAASVLHKSLVTDLKNIKELEKAESAAAAKAGVTSKVAAEPSKRCIKLEVDAVVAECCTPGDRQQTQELEQQPGQHQVPQQADEPSSQSGAGSENAASTGSQKRRWTLTGQHRRSLSGGRGNPWSAAGEQGASRPPSRRSLSSRAHSRKGSRGQSDFGAPPSPLSPRMLMSVVLGTSVGGQEQLSFEQDDKGVDKNVDLELAPVSPRSQALQLPFIPAVRDVVEQQQQQPESLARCDSSSSSSCAADDDLQAPFWDNEIRLSLPPVFGEIASPKCQQEQQQSHESSSSPLLAEAAQPQPALDSLLDVLFTQYTWSSCVKCSNHRVCDESMGEDSITCGVCLDETPTACIVPCNHSMCAGCAMDMIERFSLSTAVCPFCRSIIRGFGPTNMATLAGTPAAAAECATGSQKEL